MTIFSRLKPPENSYSVTVPRAHIFFSYNDYQSFETPRINNRSETAPNSQILLGDDNA